jgi:hypothetical protein
VLGRYRAGGYDDALLAHWVALSKHHAFFSWKATVEYLRRSPWIAGHSWWLFQVIIIIIMIMMMIVMMMMMVMMMTTTMTMMMVYYCLSKRTPLLF